MVTRLKQRIRSGNKGRLEGLAALLLAVALVFGLMPGISLTAYADPVDYPLWVVGQQVTSEYLSGTGWEFTPGTNTLTLNNASIDAGPNTSGIKYYKETRGEPLNIILNGDNTISGNSLTNGIYGDYLGSFTFSGNGTLNTTGKSSGIGSVFGNVTINSGTIHASGTGNNSGGIYTNGNVTINGGNVETTGANYGIQTKYGVSITGGTVTAEAKSNISNDIYAIYDGGGTSISITGGTVTAKGTSSSNNAYGLFMGSSGSITIGSGITSLTITGTTSASRGKVKNSVVGMGWPTVAGAGDGTEIAENPERVLY